MDTKVKRWDLDSGLAYIVNDEAPAPNRILHLMDEEDPTRSVCGRASTEGANAMTLQYVSELRHADYRHCSWCDRSIGAR